MKINRKYHYFINSKPLNLHIVLNYSEKKKEKGRGRKIGRGRERGRGNLEGSFLLDFNVLNLFHLL